MSGPMNMEDTGRIARIRHLNDLLRQTFILGTGEHFLTRGVADLPKETRQKVLVEVQNFDDFTPENDPYGEHEFGCVTVDGHKVFWKIDYYDLSMQYGSEDPADPKQTRRVLTIMLAEEY